jgi:hypothetical protein
VFALHLEPRHCGRNVWVTLLFARLTQLGGSNNNDDKLENYNDEGDDKGEGRGCRLSSWARKQTDYYGDRQ